MTGVEEIRKGDACVTIDDLKNIRGLRLEIEDYNERIMRLCSAMCRTTTQITGMPGAAPRPDKIARQLAKMEDLQTAILDKIIKCETRILKVEQVVDRLQRNFRQVLRLRYFEGYEWEDIAETEHWSLRACHYIHRRALAEMENLCTTLHIET